MEKNSQINIVFISNDDYVMPTAVAIHSLIESKDSCTRYKVYIVASSLLPENIELLKRLQSEGTKIKIVTASADKLKNLHNHDESAICVASIDALFKFLLPDLLPLEEKVLYLDGDILVRKDLSELYQYDIDDYYAAVVMDSGSIYYKHKYVKMVERYFNSGVMLLNLKKFRENNLSEILMERKREEKDSNLMDQNIFNLIFNGNVKFLPIKYNFLTVNLERSFGKWTMGQINDSYGTNYECLEDIRKDAYIVHYSSKDKPWKFSGISMANEWYKSFLSMDFPGKIERKTVNISEESEQEESLKVKVSIIVPVYNAVNYLKDSIISALCQTLAEIEVICVNDGSEDGSLEILQKYADKDSRIIILNQQNSGQSVARNKAVRNAKGEYVYFLDADDMIVPEAMEVLYERAKKRRLDTILFDGSAFYEEEGLEEEFAQYKTYYQHKYNYKGVRNGQKLYAEMMLKWDFKVSPCLQMVRREHMIENDVWFPEGIIHEDTFFSFLNLIRSKRVMCVRKSLFLRRVRPESTMTKKVTYKNTIGYYVSSYKILETLQEEEVTKDVIVAASKQALLQFDRVAEGFEGVLSEQDIELLNKDGRFCDIPYQFLIKPMTQIGRLYAENKRLKMQIKNQSNLLKKKSIPNQIGRGITWLPRKIRDFIRNKFRK